MRILWFSNTPSLAIKEISNSYNVGGSWIESLEQEVVGFPDVELGLAFARLTKKVRKIKVKGSPTTYYMTPRFPHSKSERWLQRFTNGPLSQKSLQYYLEVVGDFKPDVVMFFGSELDFPLIIPHLKVPSAIWFQGNVTVYEHMYQSGIPINKTLRYESWKDILLGNTYLQSYRQFKRKAQREKEIFSYATNFIGRTDWDRRVVNVLAPQAKYHFCEDAIRPAFFENQWIPHENRDKFVITTTIKANLYKGLECIMETARLLAPFLGKKLEWRIIGTKPNSAFDKIARGFTGFPRSNQSVKILGRKSGTEVIEELLNADLYVHPSHIENSPNGIKEAMLIGLPVIATNVGGTPNLLTDGKEGFLVQNGDPYALCGAILEIYRQPQKAAQMGRKGRELGLVRSDNKQIGKDLLQIYHQMLQEANPPALMIEESVMISGDD